MNRRFMAEAYASLLSVVYPMAAAESATPPLPPEMEIQACWAAGLLGNTGETLRHGPVQILDVGMWNRSVGPDFLRAEIEINGERRRGDIEIDPTPQDWERHGHGANPDFNRVILHVVLTPPEQGWYTRNAEHRDVPILYLSPSVWLAAMGKEKHPRHAEVALCRRPLEQLPASAIDGLLRTAAAYRMEKKRSFFRRKAAALGTRQAWFEAWAETLGYSANKHAMQMLVRRAPLKMLGANAEAILLGTAGFLMPVLPERCSPEARAYHRTVWDGWWELRESFELSHSHAIPWNMAAIRPMNHPHRRVAALALSAGKWRAIEPCLNAAGADRLREILTSVSHPFWDNHCTLASAALRHSSALVGQQRVDDFLVNHVYVQDESDAAWQTYLSMGAGAQPSTVRRVAQALFGERADLKKVLTRHYAHQALLQIESDFCSVNICKECMFPSRLSEWTGDAAR